MWVGDVIAFRFAGGGDSGLIRLVNAATGVVASTYMPSTATSFGTNAWVYDGTHIVSVYNTASGIMGRATAVSGTTIGTEGAEVSGFATTSLSVHISPGGDAAFIGNATANHAYTLSGATLTAITAPTSGGHPFLWTGFLP